VTAACIDELVRAWALDEIAQQAFGTEYRVAVTWVPCPVPGAPNVIAPGWYLAITTRNPIIGEPRLCHTMPIGMPEPDEKTVRRVTAEGLSLLRDLTASKLAGVNGHDPAAAR
jgi:hypothetical protein